MSNEWYVAVEGQVYGPMSSEALRQSALEGRITSQTQIRQGVSGAWKTAGEWEALFHRESAAVWRIMTADQRVLGPISKEALDTWVREGRIDSSCQVLKDGWEQWRWAGDIYPELSSPDPAGPPRAIPVAPLVQASEEPPGFPGIVTESVTEEYVSSHSAPQPAISEGHGYGDSTKKKKQPPVSAKVVAALILFGLPLLCCSGFILDVMNTKHKDSFDHFLEEWDKLTPEEQRAKDLQATREMMQEQREKRQREGR